MAAEKDKPGWLPGFNDIIPLTAPSFSGKETLLCNIIQPNNYSPGLLRTQEGLRVFSQRLRAHCQSFERAAPLTNYLTRVLALLDGLEKIPTWTAHDSAWACVPSLDVNEESINNAFTYQVEVHRALEEIEGYLIKVNIDPKGSTAGDSIDRKHGFCYDTLLVEHIRQAITLCKDSQSQENPDTVLPTPLEQDHDRTRAWLDQAMIDYWDHLPELAQRVASYTGCEVQVASDAWIMLIFRAFCWHHCHRFLGQKMILPIEWHKSQMPVFMG